MVGIDNLAAHPVAGVEAALRTVGAGLLYLPPDSPEFHPIEQLFARLKALLRKAGAPTREVLRATIGELLDAVAPEDDRHYLRNGGDEPV